MQGRRGQFRSKTEAKNLRKAKWACLKCTATFTEKTKECDECHNPVMYFASTGELRRYRSLQVQQRGGLIKNLEVQVPYRVVINDKKICTYNADFRYTKLDSNLQELQVVEDFKGTKNEKYLDPAFKLKRKLIEAVFGISIAISSN